MILASPTGDVPIVSAARPFDPWRQWQSLATDTYTGKSVTPEAAMAIGAVFGAVNLVSTTIGTIPLEIIDTSKEGNPVITNSKLGTMLRYQPNSDMTGGVMWTLVAAHIMLRGNAYAAKLRNKQGYVNELVPFPPDTVFPFRGKNGQKLFRVRRYEGTTAIDEVYTPRDILHFCGPSFDDGLSGSSPIGVMRNRMGVQLAASEYQARFYQNGAALKGVIETPMTLTQEAGERLRNSWESANAGLENSHRTAVLEQGASFRAISISPEDTQLIETLKWGATEIATAFSIPASRLNADSGKGMRYANSEQDDLHFLKSAIGPRIVYIEEALNTDPDLFGASSAWIPRFNIDSLLRTDANNRWNVYQVASRIGALNPNEIRAFEGMSPRPGGDEYTVITPTGRPHGA